jgi:hypothetical protein
MHEDSFILNPLGIPPIRIGREPLANAPSALNSNVRRVEAKPDMTWLNSPRCSNPGAERRSRRVRFGAHFFIYLVVSGQSVLSKGIP